MKPYYQQDGITIYHGDCREVLNAGISADVLVTDPPYNVDFAGKNTRHTKRSADGYIGDDSDVGPACVMRLLNSVKRAAVFPGSRMLFEYPAPADIGAVYCPSGAGIGRWGFCCFHPVLFYGKRKPDGCYPSSILSFETSPECGHPCPKPLGWMTWLVQLASHRIETVIDPFCGSGTTLRACKDTGRKAIGIEIEERYCEIAANRLSQQVLAL